MSIVNVSIKVSNEQFRCLSILIELNLLHFQSFVRLEVAQPKSFRLPVVSNIFRFGSRHIPHVILVVIDEQEVFVVVLVGR